MAIRFVIADDNAMFRKVVCGILKTSGSEYELTGEAINGNEAIALIDLCTPDLLILDLHMPELDGFGVMLHIRDRYPLLKILILTFNDSQVTQEKALKYGADTFCSKACSRADLLMSLERVMAGHGGTSSPKDEDGMIRIPEG